MFAPRIVCIHILLLLSWTADSNRLYDSSNLNEEVLNRILTALEKAYDFYESEFENINLDGIYGLRFSEGAVVKILHEHKVGKLNLSKSLFTRISLLERKAAKAADKSLPHLKQANPRYYKKFVTVVEKPWTNFKPYKRLDYSLYVPVNKRSQISFDEDTSDHCMTEMTGTGGQKLIKPCQLSGQCWNMMMAKGADGYTLTHQALFLLMGEVQGCKKVLLEKLKSSNSKMNLEIVYDRICASMYPQMVEFENIQKHNFEYERDLYMEQAMVCGSMGYYEFLSLKRLKKILKWQKKSGCYGDPDDESSKRENIPSTSRHDEAKKTLILEEKLYDDLKGYRSKIGANSRKLMSMKTMRSLLVEKALSGGCMSHITGVATGLLGVYLRWAVHLMYPGHDNKTSINPKKPSQDLPEKTNHVFMRKVMHYQPLAAMPHVQEKKRRPTGTVYFVLAVFILLLVLGHRLIIKNSRKILQDMLGLYRKTEALRIWDKNATQKRNI